MKHKFASLLFSPFSFQWTILKRDLLRLFLSIIAKQWMSLIFTTTIKFILLNWISIVKEFKTYLFFLSSWYFVYRIVSKSHPFICSQRFLLLFFFCHKFYQFREELFQFAASKFFNLAKKTELRHSQFGFQIFAQP